MDTQLPDEKVRAPATDAPDTQEDVEGHSVFSAIAASGVLRARAAGEGQTARTRADEALPPLSKPFPSMRHEHRK